jgi:ketosteroid isomerase-like protein
MINPAKGLIEKFYSSFKNRDAATMISCYDEDIVFTDPVFGELKGEDVCAMWTMLCKNAKDLKLEFSGINASLKKGSARWEAWYTFSKTGRKVHNIVDAEFEFKNGKITRHTDSFNLHKWASQALGFTGWLIGGTTYFKNKMQSQTIKTLNDFRDKNEKPRV